MVQGKWFRSVTPVSLEYCYFVDVEIKALRLKRCGSNAVAQTLWLKHCGSNTVALRIPVVLRILVALQTLVALQVLVALQILVALQTQRCSDTGSAQLD